MVYGFCSWSREGIGAVECGVRKAGTSIGSTGPWAKKFHLTGEGVFYR
jgi:hypothetical protein